MREKRNISDVRKLPLHTYFSWLQLDRSTRLQLIASGSSRSITESSSFRSEKRPSLSTQCTFFPFPILPPSCAINIDYIIISRDAFSRFHKHYFMYLSNIILASRMRKRGQVRNRFLWKLSSSRSQFFYFILEPHLSLFSNN